MTTIETILNFIAFKPAPSPARLDEDEWEDVAVTAIVLGLAPLLHWYLEQHRLAPPPMVMAKLGLTRQAHATRNQAIANQLAEILQACHQHNLKPIVLKGALLAPLAYPQPALRPMNDIDLLFSAEDLAAVGPLLESLGYRGKHKDADLGPGVTKHLSTYRRVGENGATPNPYLSAAGDRTVEPHGSLEEAWFGLKVDITPGIRARLLPVTLHNQPACRLSTPDLVLHLSVHAAFHVIMGAAVFVQLYDIGRVIETWPHDLNWPQVMSSARQAGAQPFVYAALYWSKTLYRAAIPDDVLHTLKIECSPDLMAYVHQLDANALFKRTQQPPLTTLNQRLKRGLADRREAARWAKSPGEKWKIWQSALAFHKTDTAGLLMGKPLKTDA